MIKCILLILAFAGVILAVERPEWYPENASEIERKCKEEHPISPETLAELKKFIVVDTPDMRALAYCGATGKNVFRPAKGFEPERFDASLKYAVGIDCKLERIRDCAETHKDLQPDEAMFFKTVQCVFDNIQENCNKIE